MCRLLLAQDLHLYNNNIGDDGMIAFSDAISKGAMAKLTYLGLSTNQIGNEGMQALSSAIANGAMAKLTYLSLRENQIGNEGMQALSSAIANGSMGKLRVSASLLPPPFLPCPHMHLVCGTGTQFAQQPD
jgi:Ran GTPase-activating protein (RanGAP) involved in mRNA processing and transport